MVHQLVFSTYFIILCPVLAVIIPALLTSAFHQAVASLPASLLASAPQTAASPPARIQRCPYMLHTLRKERHFLRESWPCCCGHCLQGRRTGHLSAGCNAFSSLYGEVSTSDSSASEPRLVPIVEVRKEKLLGTDRMNCLLTKSEFTSPEMDPESWPLNQDLQPLR